MYAIDTFFFQVCVYWLHITRIPIDLTNYHRIVQRSKLNKETKIIT